MVDQNPTADQVAAGNDAGSSPLEENIRSRSTWLRLLFMLIYYILISLASLVGTFVVVVGFFWVLFTGEVNQQLRQVGQGIASYIYEIVRYLTYNTEEKPFPFGRDWPSAAADGGGAGLE
jgi:hypothetical protein